MVLSAMFFFPKRPHHSVLTLGMCRATRCVFPLPVPAPYCVSLQLCNAHCTPTTSHAQTVDLWVRGNVGVAMEEHAPVYRHPRKWSQIDHPSGCVALPFPHVASGDHSPKRTASPLPRAHSTQHEIDLQNPPEGDLEALQWLGQVAVNQTVDDGTKLQLLLQVMKGREGLRDHSKLIRAPQSQWQPRHKASEVAEVPHLPPSVAWSGSLRPQSVTRNTQNTQSEIRMLLDWVCAVAFWVRVLMAAHRCKSAPGAVTSGCHLSK